MKKTSIKICLLLTAFFLLLAPRLYAQDMLRMATTTSTDNSGLLDEILPYFEKEFKLKVDVIAVGTGKALKLAENGDVDLVFVHARQAEDKFVENGLGVNRRDVMYNDFVLIGPKDDPAHIRGVNVREAFSKISESKAFFTSRGDESGTHKRELMLWKMADIKPQGRWYLEVGQGMGATLKIADEKKAYCLVDRGTYIAYEDKVELTVLSEGDKLLFNPYGIIAVNPEKHFNVKYDYAMQFITWITSWQGQQLIADFRKNGKQLFVPNANKIEE